MANTTCTLDDVEICERNVDVISDVNYDGEATHFIEHWSDESWPAYYHCRECGEFWEIDEARDQEQTFKLVKEHLHE